MQGMEESDISKRSGRLMAKAAIFNGTLRGSGRFDPCPLLQFAQMRGYTMDTNGWTAFEEAEPDFSACLYGYLLVWHVYRGVVVETWENRRATPMYTHWISMPRRGWVASVERLPTAEDANVTNCVLARHCLDGIMVTGWRRFEDEKRLTHWMRTPPPPVDAEKHRRMFE